MKELEVIALQNKRERYRFAAYNSQSKENRTNFWNI